MYLRKITFFYGVFLRGGLTFWGEMKFMQSSFVCLFVIEGLNNIKCINSNIAYKIVLFGVFVERRSINTFIL